MKAALERLATAWRNLPQSTKLLLAGFLLVSAVAIWYVGLYLPAQITAVAEPTPVPAPQVTPKAIEAPPIPPLEAQGQATATPTPSGPTPPKAQPEKPLATEVPKTQATAPVPQPSNEPPLPNPFVPLVVETPPPAPLPTPTPAPRPTPVPTGPPVRVSPGTPLPVPSVGQTPPRPLPGSQGALPAPKVLVPALRVETPKAELETPPTLTPPAGLAETGLPTQTPKEKGKTGPTSKSSKTPLETLVEEKGLKLAGTLLGPVSIAILESKEGYLVLPAGSLLPGSEAVLRHIESGRVVLALKDENLEITLDSMQEGGGQ